MNKPGPEHDEREWQAQERALREVRDGPGMPSEDSAVAQYRDIANALRQPPHATLPADFAASVARIAAGRAPVPAGETRFEQVLVRVLAALFVLSALLAFGIYGGRLLAMLQAATDAGGLRWVLGLATCIGLSWSLDWMRRQWHHDAHEGSPHRAA